MCTSMCHQKRVCAILLPRLIFFPNSGTNFSGKHDGAWAQFFWGGFTPFCAVLRQIAPMVIKNESVLVRRCMIHQKMRNHQLLGGVLRVFFSQGTGSANLAPFCAKLRQTAPTYKRWTSTRMKMYDTPKKVQSSNFGGCSKIIFTSVQRKCDVGAFLRQIAPNCAHL